MLSFLLSSILIILIKTCAGNSCVYYLATDRYEIKGLLLRDVLMSEITPVWSLNGPAVCVCVCVCMVYRTGTAHLSSLLLPWQSLHCTKPTPYGCYGNVPPFFWLFPWARCICQLVTTGGWWEWVCMCVSLLEETNQEHRAFRRDKSLKNQAEACAFTNS